MKGRNISKEKESGDNRLPTLNNHLEKDLRNSNNSKEVLQFILED